MAIGVVPFIVTDSTWRRAWVYAGPRSQIISRQVHAIERRVIILDDLADDQPELLQRGGVAAGLFLKLGEADLPFRLDVMLSQRRNTRAAPRSPMDPTNLRQRPESSSRILLRSSPSRSSSSRRTIRILPRGPRR